MPAQESGAVSSIPEALPASSDPPAPSEEPAPEDETLYVSTAGEFLEAIAPGAVIELAPGVYNLTEYLHEAPDDISDYIVRGFSSDGWQAEIRGVGNLTIRGEEGGKTEVVAEPRYSDVIYFNACSDIAIENITFGHTTEKGSCEGAVLAFDDCRNINLDGLDLYGCGTYGVAADHTAGITLQDCIIRDCSYGIIDMIFCSDVTCEDCTFRDNGGYDMLSLRGSFVLFDGCAFAGNEGSSFLPADYSRGSESGARFAHCTFDRWESQHLNEELKGRGNFVIGKDCQFRVEPGRRTVYASSMEQLIENIAPDTQIMLAPGKYNLSDTLSELFAQEGEHFNESREFVRIDEVADGLELVVTGVSGFTIASESGSAADTEIVTDPRYADVINFENCSGTGIMNLAMGHTEADKCAGDVLYFTFCSDTVLCGLDLYGCGAYGISADECGLLTCFDSTIRDCEDGTLKLYAAQEREMFLNCVMTGSGRGGFFFADNESGGEFYFWRCIFGERESSSFASLVSDGVIVAEDCSWSDMTEPPILDDKSACEFDATRVQYDYAVIGSDFGDFLSTVLTFRLIKAFDKGYKNA
ncbi:right-handed parallel beta-helix repeat-containing protein [Lachnoclostridium sp. Marseille-P6806]|uniref:right-handed parallel beta-helix repeat-containing protein n=1 Tax=Lachnoclostridium sp. Marseille-P6806 TaxID=2364793 RepID=UPI0013EF094C|nr:right-handed parallel beta-helix repeat-containing protein [Lachnoclostridium sp. Marseille-P6806]